MANLTDIRKWADSRARVHASAHEFLVNEKAKLKEAEAHLADTEQAQVILQQVAQKVQQQAHAKIASVVSRCLKAVFGDEAYEFKLEFERKRGRTEARIVFLDGENEVVPTLGSGGGVIDVAAFALRLACLVLTKPPVRKLLVLDEPMKNVNGTVYRERVRSLIETVSREFEVQIIITTGYDWLKMGKVVELP